MNIILYAILAYILYRFIFKLVIPVYIASRKIKKGFREMHSRMQHPFDSAQDDKKQGFQPQTAGSKPASKGKAGDYIDFEEIK